MLTDRAARRVETYLDKLGKLKLWSGVIGTQSLQNHVNRQAVNQSAEDAYVRRKAWEEPPGAGATAVSEDMGTTILGDVTNPTPIVIHSQPQSHGLGKVLAGAAIAAAMIGIPGAGLAGFLLTQLANNNKPAVLPPPTPPNFTDKTLDIGLRHFDDLTK